MTGPPTRLRTEHLVEPRGLDVDRPRLSWWPPAGDLPQLAYQVAVDGVEGSWVDDPECFLRPWPAADVEPGATVWRVRVRTAAGVSPWSEPARLTRAPRDWVGRFVGPHEERLADPGTRPVYRLRTTFTLARTGQAVLRATAHGIYEAFLDGTRVGDEELTPGPSAYGGRLVVQELEAGPLEAGEHTLELLLSDGWWRGQLGFTRNTCCWGDQVAALAQLEVDGAVVVATDASWSWREEPATADLIAGTTQTRTAQPGPWRPVRVEVGGLDVLTGPVAPPVRRVEECEPAAVTLLPSGAWVVDLGRTINGWVRLEGLGPRGSRVVLTHGESLDDTGDVTLEHLRPVDLGDGEPLSAGQVDLVVASGDPGETFEPRHTTHGFRYVRVEGLATPPRLTGVMVHTDLQRTGGFRCSDPRLDALHDAAVLSLRGNVCGLPTDCPTRERDGWTGDWQLFQPTAAFLFDVAGFSGGWLRDLAIEQWPDGRVPNVVPDTHGPRSWEKPLINHLTGSAGWGDAAVLVPHDLWREYGDLDVLRRQLGSMVRWVDWAAAAAASGRHPSRTGPVRAHEKWLWDTGFHWGEWCEPGTHADFSGTADLSDVATAYLHRSAALLARVLRLLDRPDDAAPYDAVARGALRAWRAEHLLDGHRLRVDTQANHVRALAFGLVPPAARAAVAERLVQLVRAAGNHVGTGFLATPHLLPVLADHGHLDVAYDLLLQTSRPSWLAMLAEGATTFWEDWDGVGPPGGAHSLNHYSKGAVVSFLHSHVAGLAQDPRSVAWSDVTVAPRPGGGVTWAKAWHDSPRGRFAVSWEVVAGRGEVAVTVPPGVRARLVLPDGTSRRLDAGETTARWEVGQAQR